MSASDADRDRPVVPVSLASRDRMLTELQENGRLSWPSGWPLWFLIDLIETLGIDPKDVNLFDGEIVVMRRV